MKRVFYIIIICLLMPLMVRAAGTNYSERLVEFEAASDGGDRKKQDEGVKKMNELLADPVSTEEQKYQALKLMIGMYWRNNQRDNVKSAAEQMTRLLPAYKPAQQTSLTTMLEIYRQARQYTQAIEKASAYLKLFPSEQPGAAQVRVKLARLLLDSRQGAACSEEAERAAGEIRDNDQLMTEALQLQADGAGADKNVQREVEALGKLMESRYLGCLGDRADGYMVRYMNGLRTLKRFDEAVKFGRVAEKKEGLPVEVRQRWCMAIAGMLNAAGRYDETRAQCEKVFVDYPGVLSQWPEAQGLIVSTLTQQEKYENALKAARVYLDSISDPGAAAGAIRMIADLFNRLDKNEIRSKQFMDFQVYGPAGADTQEGTPDDLVNPLDAFPYPDYSAREKAFASADREFGDGAHAARHRALSAIYAGQPKKAFPQFVEAFRRAARNEFDETGRELVAIGVRSLQGHPIGLEKCFQFVAYGPAGPDGKEGTADDLKDPIQPLMDACRQEPAEKKSPLLSGKELETLKKAREFLESYVVGTVDTGAGRDRREMLMALERVHSALMDWNDPELVSWYLNLLKDFDADKMADSIFDGILSSSKAGNYHLGGANAAYSNLQVKLVGGDGKMVSALAKPFRSWQSTMSSLSESRSFVPTPPKKSR